jgi:cyclohexa-1,5-dienecarbonyl-CoA hydratase
MENEFKNIIVKIRNGVGDVILNRPPLNILNIAMMTELNTALVKFRETPELRVVVISSEGKAFSAGVDVAEHTPAKVREMLHEFHKIFDNLRALQVPTIAVVSGSALGGGCELATYCDFVLASASAKFGQPEIQVGVFPPIAAIMFPTWLSSEKKAFELILTGKVISAREAKEIGLVSEVFPDENFVEDTDRYIEQFTRLSGAVLRITKRAIKEAKGLTYNEAIKKVENIYLEELMRTDDAIEGLNAFLEKRKPEWKHK